MPLFRFYHKCSPLAVYILKSIILSLSLSLSLFLFLSLTHLSPFSSTSLSHSLLSLSLSLPPSLPSQGTGTPGPVDSLRVLSDSLTSLYVAWDPPSQPNSNPIILQYTVLHHIQPAAAVSGTGGSTSVGGDGGLANNQSNSGLLLPGRADYVIEGLEVGTAYEVTVLAHSLAGYGSAAGAILASTYGTGN